MISLLLAAQLESAVFCAHIRRELVCVRSVEPVCACEPGKPVGPLNLRQMWWRSPYVT